MAREKSGWVTLVGVLFLVAGWFNVTWGLLGLGASLGGNEPAIRGDLAVNDMTGPGIAGLVIGGLELLAGIGILKRMNGAWSVGVALAGATIVINFAYQEVLDGWAFSGMLLNLAIVAILCLRADEFS